MTKATKETEVTKGTWAAWVAGAGCAAGVGWLLWGLRRFGRLRHLCFLSLLCPLCLFGNEVHVYEQTLAGGVVSRLSDRTLDTGNTYSTQSAPSKSGYIFTHWSISGETSGFVSRDRYGRAKAVASYRLYEETTLTANYLPASQDSDGDGVADGWEIYWYGNLDNGAASDTDGDGVTFADEIVAGTNPLVVNGLRKGVIVWRDSELIQYNPDNLHPYVIRSEPENSLFTTRSDYLKPGATIPVPTVGGNFAYWMIDGVRQADRHGRAKKSLSVAMPDREIEIVAVAESDAMRRNALYWYGDASIPPESDTDGDGVTFADEIAAGTNPLVANGRREGVIVWRDSELMQYNPENLHPYVIRSEPEGGLFATRSDYLKPGQAIPIPSASGNFAYWTIDGVRQADRYGRARRSLSVLMPSAAIEVVAMAEADPMRRNALYWYGDAAVSQESDTDGDGKTFAEEIADGTNPLVANGRREGVIVWADSALVETDLQVYEHVKGVVLNGSFNSIFESATFGNGGAVWPVVADVNDDGLWDLIVCWEDGVKVFVNVGSKGNPEFEVDASGALGERALPWLAMNSTDKLAEFTLDVPPPVDALSATTNGTALLVSDSEGRIWYYMGNGEQGTGNGVAGPTNYQPPTTNYQLQHKVWGGSRVGFAEGLRLAAVDWDDDGDLDCLAGTADGKLMLLRDPKVGRPTNLKAFAGVDNILLTWDPNQQSRIRGYRVYRGTGNGEQETEGDFARIAQPPLPTYRDFPPTTDEYAYKVSSVSRFYTVGNSTPTETESPATEAVVAKTGGVKFFWNDAVTKVGEKVEVMLSIENSMNYNVAGKSQTVVYDPEYLTPVKVVKTGLTEGFDIADSHSEQGGASPSGSWQITIIGAVGGGTPTLPAGGGKFLVLVFEAQKEGTTTVGGETGATVSIAAGAAIAPYQLGDVDGDGDVDEADLRLLAKLKNGTGHKHTANQLKAGDFNGNGKLDNADYQALRKLLKEKGIIK